MDKKTEEFYARLRQELAAAGTWPAEYLYKFIVPSDNHKIAQVEAAFNQMGAVIKTTQSKNGNFTSISVNVTMENPQHVIEKYIEVSAVEGIISL